MIGLEELEERIGKKLIIDRDVVGHQTIFRTKSKSISVPDSRVRTIGFEAVIDMVVENLK